MKRAGIVFGALVFLATAGLDKVNAEPLETLRAAAQAVDGTAAGDQAAPQQVVVCAGWHALCSASTDCRMIGDMAYCDCLRVDEPHLVLTDSIRDAALKRLTQATCTNAHPCALDQAPVCHALRLGEYEVDNIKYAWVSTYSYRGWCSLLEARFKPCDPDAAGYAGDRYWAICDGAPCTENPNPSDPDRPLTCQCPVQNTPFMGTGGRCSGNNGGIISAFPSWAWDFQNNTFRIAAPGYEFVRGACAALKSDPPEEPRRGSESR